MWYLQDPGNWPHLRTGILNVLEINQSSAPAPVAPCARQPYGEPPANSAPWGIHNWSPGLTSRPSLPVQLTLLMSLKHPPVPSWANWGFSSLLSPTRLLWALATYPLSRTSLKSGPPTLNPLPPPAAEKRYMKGGGCKGDSQIRSFVEQGREGTCGPHPPQGPFPTILSS